MSGGYKARRTQVNVFFDGVDISETISKYLISLTYTDNEANEADDLQLVLEDSESIWLEQWLIDAVESASETQSSMYKVTSPTGISVRSSSKEKSKSIGSLPYGSEVRVQTIEGKWAVIKYSGKTGYVLASGLSVVSSESSEIESGMSVLVTGEPQYTSFGGGTSGAPVINYEGTVSNVNNKSAVPFPIHIGTLGWFSKDQVTLKKSSGQNIQRASSVRGLKIQADIIQVNWNERDEYSVLNCGQFELDDISASGPPSKITIKATSIPYESRVRKIKRTRVWSDYRLSGVGKEIAGKAGMAFMFNSSIDPILKRTEQLQMSDIEFLQELCSDYGLFLKVTNNIIVIYDPAEFQNSGEQLVITKGDGSYTRYKLGTGSKDAYYSSCRVSYTNPEDGTLIEGIASDVSLPDFDNARRRLELNEKVTSKEQAAELASKRLRERNQFGKKASFTLLGNTSAVAGINASLKRFGLWNKNYTISQAIHEIGSSGYSTKIRLRENRGN